jgi:hypothetical protein
LFLAANLAEAGGIIGAHYATDTVRRIGFANRSGHAIAWTNTAVPTLCKAGCSGSKGKLSLRTDNVDQMRHLRTQNLLISRVHGLKRGGQNLIIAK